MWKSIFLDVAGVSARAPASKVLRAAAQPSKPSANTVSGASGKVNSPPTGTLPA